jgi:hypothetical protein
MSLLTSWLDVPPADAAIEIGPEAVSVAALANRGGDVAIRAYAIEPVPPGVITPSLVSANISDTRAMATVVQAALERLGTRPRRVALLMPDLAVRVSLVRFEKVPGRAEDLDQLVRWQVRKAAPFPIDEASLALSRSTTAADGTDFVAVLARRAVVREYEELCESLGMEPGLVDLSTFGVLNLVLASQPPQGDWLAVHVRPLYASVAIMRAGNLISFRTVPGDEVDALADAVHQTTMYYQDRLAGQGFAQVLFGGVGRTPAALEIARRGLEERLGTTVRPLAALRGTVLWDRIAADPEKLALLAPLVGTLLRMRVRAAA